MKKIPLCRPVIPDNLITDLKDCLDTGWIGYGPVCNKLENVFADKHGGFALATTSCTSALYLSAILNKYSSEDEAIIPAITYSSTAMAFLAAGYKIRIADVCKSTLCITEDSIKKLVTPNTRIIVIVHLYGQYVDTERISIFCKANNIILIEDCAHRIDLHDSHAPFGEFACYSFNAVKEATGGEGGLLWSSNIEIKRKAKSLANVGLDIDTTERSSSVVHKKYNFSEFIGLKLLYNDIQATMVNSALDQLLVNRKKRQEIFKAYDTAFINLEGIELIPRSDNDSYLMYVIKINDRFNRDSFRAELAKAGISTSVHYPSLSNHPVILKDNQRGLNADSYDKAIITLPCFPSLTLSEMQRVIDTVCTSTNFLLKGKHYATTIPD